MASIFRNIAGAANSLRRAASRAKEEIQHQIDKIQKNIVDMNTDEPSFYDPEYCDAEGLLITIPADEDEKSIGINMHELYEKLSDAFEPRQHVKITFQSTVPERCRDALLRFKASGSENDVHAYAATLRKLMPNDEGRVQREIDDLMDALENLRICGDKTVLNQLEKCILGSGTTFDLDLKTWTWTARATLRMTRGECDREMRVLELPPFTVEALRSNDDEPAPFDVDQVRAMRFQHKVSSMPRRNKPRALCKNLKWLDECVEMLIAEDIDA